MKKLIVLICIAIFVHFWQLGNIPFGVANDEASYIYSSYTIWKTGGYDIQGKFLPLSINVDSSLSPGPVYIVSPFVGILGLSPFTARLPFALLSVGSTILVFFIAKMLFENEWIGFFAGLSFTIAPWYLLVSRGVWDGNMAMFFYLLGIYLFVRGIQKKTHILWSLVPFLIGFYSYHGMKVFFVAFIPVLVIIFWSHLMQRKKELGIFIAGVLLIVSSFLFIIKTQAVTRQEELFWSNPKTLTKITKEVNYQREKSSGSTIEKEVFDNKLIGLMETFAGNYFGAFSTEHLFTIGDINRIVGYGTFFRGALYLVDAPMLILGLYFLFRKGKREAVLLTIGGLIIAPLPSAVGSGTTYVIRSMMMLPFLSFIIGLGWYQFLQWMKKIPLVINGLLIIGLVGFYLFFIGRFIYQYTQQFSTYGGEYWNSTSRQLSEYILTNSSIYNHIYISGAELNVMIQYAIFSKADPHTFQKLWTHRDNATLGKVHFFNNCLNEGKGDPYGFLPAKTMFIGRSDCFAHGNPTTTIADPIEPLQIIWNIYEKH